MVTLYRPDALSYLSVNWSNPINWMHYLNVGLMAWWLNIPHWQGGTKWRDLTKRHDGTLTNMNPASAWVASNRPGGWGALDFLGTDEFVEDADGEDYINGLAGFTASMWVKSDLTNVDRGILYGTEVHSGDGPLSIRYDSSGFSGGESEVIKIGITVTAADMQLESSGNVQTLDWQHILMTWGGDQLSLYLDGFLDTPSFVSAGSGGTIKDLDTLRIGGVGSGSPSGVWNGLIDDVRIYNRALSAAEIAWYYQLSRQGNPGLLNRTGVPVNSEIAAAAAAPKLLAMMGVGD